MWIYLINNILQYNSYSNIFPEFHIKNVEINNDLFNNYITDDNNNIFIADILYKEINENNYNYIFITDIIYNEINENNRGVFYDNFSFNISDSIINATINYDKPWVIQLKVW